MVYFMRRRPVGAGPVAVFVDVFIGLFYAALKLKWLVCKKNTDILNERGLFLKQQLAWVSI
jgi:hypothetical protein